MPGDGPKSNQVADAMLRLATKAVISGGGGRFLAKSGCIEFMPGEKFILAGLNMDGRLYGVMSGTYETISPMRTECDLRRLPKYDTIRAKFINESGPECEVADIVTTRNPMFGMCDEEILMVDAMSGGGRS